MTLLRTALRWLATLVALGATLVAVLSFLWWKDSAFLPFNEEGRHFEPGPGVVRTEDEPWAAGVLTGAALALAGGAAFMRSKLRRS